MPEELFAGDLPKAQFDIAVAMKGYLIEAKAMQKSHDNGMTSSRSEALALAQRARADVYEMETGKKRA